MYVPKQKIILKVILNNTNHKFLLGQVVNLINHNLPAPKRMTPRCIAKIISSMSRSGCFVLNKEVMGRGRKEVYYEFKLCVGDNQDEN